MINDIIHNDRQELERILNEKYNNSTKIKILKY